MTLDEFQARLRAACDTHIYNCQASTESFNRACEALAVEAGKPEGDIQKAIVAAEFNRMVKALS